MIDSLQDRFSSIERSIGGTRTHDKIGTVRKVTGLIIESEGPKFALAKYALSVRTDTEIVQKLKWLAFLKTRFY